MISKGANVNVVDEKGNTPLMYTVIYGPFPNIAELLLKHGADPNIQNTDGNTYESVETL
ncbi:hypothetical protein SAGO17_0070 [Mimivirus AB-566-O17]|uniref:Uncharacterized protein n=1 Tax=Mimivirus AB-566-O17 TaxID=1988039 RepID=A0A1X9VNU7_9VIRU|nr:hypothetical protein SAGO17_0070 [Mimivirus AB-566-O17]